MVKISFFLVKDDDSGRRLDNFLFSKFKKSLPKSKIYSSIRKAKIKVNQKKSKPDYKLTIGDKISYPEFTIKAKLSESPNLDTHMEVIKNSIIYDSDRFIVINKPPNYAVHGGSGLNFGVIEIIRKLYKYSENFNLAHRIDKSTSGCLVIAKKMSALRDIHKQFRQRSVKKVYECIVHGNWPNNLKVIENELEVEKTNQSERKVKKSEAGKKTKTKFTIHKKYKDFTSLIALPHTGRTHQIRFHCFDAGYPILGDEKYALKAASTKAKRLMLHAKEITFMDGEKIIHVEALEKYNFFDGRDERT
tara:strand:- start:1817 stop:2728 length:912 start_codon:yes stop_codon:yes gene_type:complete